VSESHAIELLPVSEAVSAEEPWLWWALTGEVRLAGMSRPPEGFPFSWLHERGLDTIVSLTGPVSYDPAPLRSHAHTLQDLYGRGAPDDPAAEEDEVRRAVATVTALLGESRSVVVHCGAGIGRTGLVIGSVLVSAGHDPGPVTSWLAAVQRARGAKGWPESPWQGEVLSSFRRP
jgi:hypothetical protein